MGATSPAGADRLQTWLGSPDWLEGLVTAHPVAAEGLARLTDAATGDGSLPASVKWLFMAAIGCVKQEDDLTSACLEQAFASGLSRDQADGAALTLLVSRGIPPYRRFIAAADQLVPRRGGETNEPPAGTVDVDEAKAYAASVYGTVPDRIRLMADEVPRALEGHLLLRRSGLRDTGLSPLHTELLLVAINSSLQEPDFVAAHAAAARKEGASDTELAEAAVTAVPFGGLAAWHAGAAGIAASRGRGRAGGRHLTHGAGAVG